MILLSLLSQHRTSTYTNAIREKENNRYIDGEETGLSNFASNVIFYPEKPRKVTDK